MSDIGKIVSGFRVFKSTTYQKQKDIIHHLLEQGQKPTTMVITCSDIRISPSEIFAANPGELYILSNVGGIVPKFDAKGIHGIMAAIEYAVKEIEVQNIIILGHAKCNAMKMIMSENFVESKKKLSESMHTWLSIASEAREAVKREMTDKSEEEQLEACEHESLVVSMHNLMEYPYVAEAVKKQKLNVIGWHFDIEKGEIMSFNPDNGFFEPIS